MASLGNGDSCAGARTIVRLLGAGQRWSRSECAFNYSHTILWAADEPRGTVGWSGSWRPRAPTVWHRAPCECVATLALERLRMCAPTRIKLIGWKAQLRRGVVWRRPNESSLHSPAHKSLRARLIARDVAQRVRAQSEHTRRYSLVGALDLVARRRRRVSLDANSVLTRCFAHTGATQKQQQQPATTTTTPATATYS